MNMMKGNEISRLGTLLNNGSLTSNCDYLIYALK